MNTLILEGDLTHAQVQEVARLLGTPSLTPVSARAWTMDSPHPHDHPITRRARAAADAMHADLNTQSPLRLTDMKLAVMDMDSTLITIECIDEIAAMQGLKPQVAAITEAAMRGELDFSASLKRRVALLKGLPASALEAVYHERLQLSPGAQTMINEFRAAGIHTVLVSGGFTFFADRVRERLQLDEAHSNLLGIANDTLTGEVISTIVDAQAKADHLRRACAALGCAQSQTIAIGDGANDLLMMAAAGVSVAYHAKPRVKAAASCSIAHNGLNAVLNLFTR